jgi:hypothetical protein
MQVIGAACSSVDEHAAPITQSVDEHAAPITCIFVPKPIVKKGQLAIGSVAEPVAVELNISSELLKFRVMVNFWSREMATNATYQHQKQIVACIIGSRNKLFIFLLKSTQSAS